MSRAAPALWTLSVQVPPEAEEAATELMERHCHVAPGVYQDAATRRSTVTVFLPTPPRPEGPDLKRLRRDLRSLREYGLVTRTPPLRLRKLPAAEWAESWKHHFKPVEIGGTLLLRPSWSRLRCPKRLLPLTIDPGLSFGTGHHATTRFCLEQLTRLRPVPGPDRGMLDVGTGSGILAIAAARLGFRPVEAFDVDPDALRVARDNATLNGVLGQIRFVRRDLSSCGHRVGTRRFHVVCANLTADLLIDARQPLLEWVRPGGTLLLAGILTRQFPRVTEVYQAAGGHLIASRREKEWTSGRFCFEGLPVS